MPLYRKKATVEAIEFARPNRVEISNWLFDAGQSGYSTPDELKFDDFHTPGASHVPQPGNMVMKGAEGEIYVCPRSVFEKTFEEVVPGRNNN